MNNKIYSGRTAAVVTISLALYLAGVAAYIIMGATHTLHDMAGEVQVSITVRDSDKIAPELIIKEISEDSRVRKVVYIDSTRAERDFSAHLGFDIAQFMGSGVLPSSFIVTLHTHGATRDGVEALKRIVADYQWVDEIHYDVLVSKQVEKNVALMNQFSLWIGGVLVFVALILIYIAMKLSIGATFNCYEREAYRLLCKECYRWAWIAGVVGGFVATGMLWFTVKISDVVLPELGFGYDTLPFISAMLIVGSTITALLSASIAISVTRK